MLIIQYKMTKHAHFNYIKLLHLVLTDWFDTPFFILLLPAIPVIEMLRFSNHA